MSTTEIYTRVSIKHLEAVHERTHPGARIEPRRETARPPRPDEPEP